MRLSKAEKERRAEVHKQLVETRYKRQAETFVKNHGHDAYKINGMQGGGKNSPGSFNSESARKAALILWDKRRAVKAKQLKKEQEAEDGS